MLKEGERRRDEQIKVESFSFSPPHINWETNLLKLEIKVAV